MTRFSIATDGENVSAHFGRCPSYTLVDIENGKVINQEKVDNPGHSPGRIPQYMHENNVDVMITGGMGARAIQFFNQFGIQTIMGVSGLISECIEQIVNNELVAGESTCSPRSGKGYGLAREDEHEHHEN